MVHRVLHRPADDAARQRGAALVVALISTVVVAALAVTLLHAVDSERIGVVIESDRLQALKMGEGLLEIAENELLEAIANYRPMPDPPADAPFQVMTGTFSSDLGDHVWTVSHSTRLNGAGEEELVPPSTVTDAATGLNVTIEPMVLEANVRVRTSAIQVRKYIEVRKTPIFQFLAYYDGDLEILPGPAMVLNGRVHSNRRLYMAPGDSLSITSRYVRTAMDFYRRRKDSDDIPSGWIKIQNMLTDSLVKLPSEQDFANRGIDSVAGLDSAFTGWDFDGDGVFDESGELPPFKTVAEDLFGGTLQTGEHGVKPLSPPSIGAIQPYVTSEGGAYAEIAPGDFAYVGEGFGTHSKSYFHDNADLVVINGHVFDQSGTDITSLMPTGFLVTKNVWDQREGRVVATTVINVGKLGDMDGNPSTLDPCPYYPDNGLLYATHTSGGSSGGIVITNGKELNVPSKWNSANYGGGGGLGGLLGSLLPVALPGSAPAGAYPFGNSETMGLTVVSPEPVYVHGDYNTIAKKPAAVIADSINLLSNSWDFTKNSGQSKTASSTTYNLAMIMGHQPTMGSQYSGGFENLPRFHENWSGKSCTILGSFISPWYSTAATGPWVYGGAWYEAPNRNWSFDTSFDQGKLPPFTPMVIGSRSIAWEVSN